MILKSTVRKSGGSIYVKMPPAFVEYYEIDKHLAQCKKKGIELECKISYTDENKVLVELPKW